MSKIHKKNSTIFNKLLSFIFAFMVIISSFLVISASAATEILKIESVTIKEKSTTVTGSITNVNNDEIDNNFVFHTVGDYVVYKIVLKNNKSDVVTINTITDNNSNSYIEYTYDKHETETISANGTLEFEVKATYKNELTDVTLRNQSTNVKFLFDLTYNGQDESSSININPKTGDKLIISILLLIFSLLGLIASIIINRKSKVSKVLVVLGLLTTPFIIKAATYEYDILLTSEYGLYDKEVVSLDVNGTIFSFPIPYNSPTSFPIVPAIDGYYFDGWKTEDGIAFDPSTPITEDIKLIANYVPIEYNIVYDLKGGSASNPTKYTIEDTINLENPNLNGYSFTGWTGTDLSEPAISVTFSNKTGNRSYTANYSPISYTVNYSGITREYALSLGNPASYTIEDSNITLVNPIKEGYSFLGWTGSNGNTPQTSVTIQSGSYGEKSYTANFSINKYTLTIDPVGGTYENVVGVQQKEEDYNTVIVLSDPTKEGYTFNGWTLTGSGTLSGSSYTYEAGNGTITASYTPIEYEIEYNGLTPEEKALLTNPTTYTIENPTITLQNPSDRVDGDGDVYERFTGWQYGSSTSTVATIPQGSTGKKTFTAIFTHVDVDTYTISYDLQDGVLAEPNPLTYTIKTETFTLHNPTKEGYNFAGWTGTGLSAPTVTVTIQNRSTGNRSYVATYTPINYSITYSGITQSYAESIGNLGQYNIETGEFSLVAPTKEGYTFDGWTGSNGTTPQTSVTIPVGTTGNLNYTANFTPIDYSISYSGIDGATVNPVNPTTYNVESGNITLTEPVKDGYDFTGWSGTDLTGNDNKNVTIPTGSTGIRSYTAHFTPTEYKINYTGLTDSEIAAYGLITEYTIESNTFNLVNPSIPGYTFDGWTGSNGTTPQTTVTIQTGSTGDKTYTPNLTIINYQITYTGLTGATVNPANETSYNVETGVIVLTEPVKEGYTFDGWTGSNGTTPQTNVTIPSGSTGDRAYEAHFSLIEYDIHYNNLTSAEVSSLGYPVKYTIESSSFTISSPSKTGYNFTGWSGTDLTGNTNMSITVSSGSTGERTYTANFELIDYHIAYDGITGATVTPANPTTYNVETGVIALTNPVKAGYTFDGWSGTGLTGNNNVDVTIPALSTGNRAYTAHWTANKYYVSFNKNHADATGTMSDQEFTYDVTGALTSNAYTRTGYLFEKWADDFGNEYNDGDNVTNLAESGTIILYAQWIDDLVTITFDPNGGNSVAAMPTNRNLPVGTLPTPTNNDSHKIFVGWVINSTDVTVLDGTYAPSGDITLTARWRNDTDVCEMNGIYYAKVQDAVNAAPASETGNPADAPQVTINLLADIHMATNQNYVLDMFTEDSNNNHLKNIILDMHGYGFYQPTGSGDNMYIVRTKGYLEMKNGYVESNSKKGSVEADGNKSRLTLNNMHIEAKHTTEGNRRQAVYNDGGTIYIIGGCELIASAPISNSYPRGTVHTLNGGTTYILDATVTTNNTSGYAISTEGGTTVLGTKDNAYDTSKVKIYGGKYALWIKSGAKAKIYDGLLFNSTTPVINDENLIIDKEDGYTIVTDNDGTNYRTYYTLMP